jgi:sugar phosphate isomerase/epimerase
MLRGMARRFVLAAQSLATTEDFATRVAASAAAGFTEIGLRPVDYRGARAAGHSDADLARILDDAGVRVTELSVLRGFSGDEASVREEATLMQMADAFGGTYMMAIDEVTESVERTAEHFAALCDRAATRGLQVALEFLPWTTIPDAATAWEVVRLADRPNGGVIVDSWHHFRGARDEAQLLAIPPERMVALQLDDADAEPAGTLLEDTLHRRRLPGEGTFPLVDFVGLLEDHGADAPISIEILSDELHALAPDEAARRTMDATRRLFAAVDARRAATQEGARGRT